MEPTPLVNGDGTSPSSSTDRPNGPSPNIWSALAVAKSRSLGAAAFRVQDVEGNGVASMAGLCVGDILVAINGRCIPTTARLRETLQRGGKIELGVVAELKDTPATHKLKVPSEDEQALGMQLCHATGISGGVVVEKVVNGSPASKGGVMPGFILESIGSEKVTNLNSVTMWRKYAKGDEECALKGKYTSMKYKCLAMELPEDMSEDSPGLSTNAGALLGVSLETMGGKSFHKLTGCTVIAAKKKCCVLENNEHTTAEATFEPEPPASTAPSQQPRAIPLQAAMAVTGAIGGAVSVLLKLATRQTQPR